MSSVCVLLKLKKQIEKCPSPTPKILNGYNHVKFMNLSHTSLNLKIIYLFNVLIKEEILIMKSMVNAESKQKYT